MSQVSYGTITITDTNDIERIYTVYAKSANNTTVPSAAKEDWSENVSTAPGTGNYIWQRTVVEKSGTGNKTYSDPVCLTGEEGTEGKGISSIIIKYGTSANWDTQPANWYDSTPEYSSATPNYWTQTTINYTTGNPTIKTTQDKALTQAIYDAVVANSIAQHANEDSQGAMSQANNGIKEIYRVWYRTNSSSTPDKPSTHVTETRNDVNDTWTKVKPIENSNYRYYFYCEETITNGGVSSWTNPVLDITTLSKYEVEALDSRTKTFFFPGDSSYPGAYVVGKNSDDGLKQDDISTYGFNTRVTTTGISIGYNEAKVLHLKTTPSPASLDFYKPPTISGNTVEEGELAASLSATGLILSKGGVKAGTPNQSGFIYLSTEPYGSYSVNGSSGISDWKEIIGTKFGVTSDGTLYADGANITNINANNISTNLLSAIQAKVTTLSTITANMGTLTAGTISYGTTGNNNSFYLSANSSKTATIAGASRSSLRLTVGSGFGVDVNGKLYATGADITGAIKAQSLTIESNATISDTSGLISNSAVEVGGRNLLYNSGTMPAVSSGDKGWRASGGTVSHIDISTPPIAGVSGGIRCTNTGSSAARIGIAQDLLANRFIAGKKYSMGCWIRASAEFSSDVAIQPIWISSSQTTNSKYISMTLSTNWQYISAESLVLNGDQASSYSAGYVYASNVPAGGYIEVCGIMLEEGTKCTSWTPAPEDVASDIEDASKVADNYLKFEPNKGLMIADVSNGTSTIDNVTTGNVLIDDNSVDIRKGQKVLTTIDGDGLTVNDDTEAPVASFLKSGATVGKAVDGQSRMVTSGTGMRFIRRNGTTDEVLAHIGYGEGQAESGTLITPYYSMGLRKSGTTIGNYSMASGHNTTASGYGSYAEGVDTTANGAASHAEGSNTTSSRKAAHAEGNTTIASGSASHAEGYETKAIEDSAHAEGSNTEANAENSHAQNLGTVAQGFSQTVIGTYNQKQGSASNSRQMTDYAFIIGNGDNDTHRSNAFAVDWNGKVWHSGDGQHNIASYVQTSKGTFVSGYIVVYGKVAQLNFTFRNTSSIAGGATLYEGTLSSNSGWLPKQAARGIGYLGPTPFIMTIGAGGGIIIQNASQATVIIPSNKSAYCTVTYIMA